MIIDTRRDDGRLIRQAIEQDHYLHRWPDPRSLPFAYRLIVDGSPCASDGRPHGVIVFKKPQHHKQKNLFGYPGLPTAWQVLDMARVWIHPDWQRTADNGHSLCMFTRLVSKCLRRVQRDWLAHHPPRYPDLPYHIRLIISYCQISHHDGTAYGAASFDRIGITNDGEKEIYARRLRQPRKRWHVAEYARLAQLPLVAGVGIEYF
jgi:hypothetical protein